MRAPIGYSLNYSGGNTLGLSLKSMEKKYFISLALVSQMKKLVIPLKILSYGGKEEPIVILLMQE